MMRRNKRMQKALADVSEHLRRGTQISGTDQVALPQQSYAFLTDTVRKLDADIKEDSSVQESTAVLLSEADAQLKAIEVESYNNYKLMLLKLPTLRDGNDDIVLKNECVILQLQQDMQIQIVKAKEKVHFKSN